MVLNCNALGALDAMRRSSSPELEGSDSQMSSILRYGCIVLFAFNSSKLGMYFSFTIGSSEDILVNP